MREYLGGGEVVRFGKQGEWKRVQCGEGGLSLLNGFEPLGWVNEVCIGWANSPQAFGSMGGFLLAIFSSRNQYYGWSRVPTAGHQAENVIGGRCTLKGGCCSTETPFRTSQCYHSGLALGCLALCSLFARPHLALQRV